MAQPSATSTTQAVKTMLRRACKAALATKDRASGAPYASLVQVATALDGRPIILVSDLAVHTRNLVADPSASLLFDESDWTGDPSAGARVSLTGRFVDDVPDDARARYLARHPGAAHFVEFGDFRFLTLAVNSAHFIQGFGRITTLPGAAIVIDGFPPDRATVDAWLAAAATLKGAFPELSGVDPEGIDLLTAAGAERIAFETPTLDASHALLTARELLLRRADQVSSSGFRGSR